jgi:general secretion pathway protein A
VYQDYFGLNSKPFGIVPDTRFLFLSDSHKEAIAHLVYALNEKNGFVQLTGEVGVGKTIACRYILANIPEDIDVALILNPRIDEIGLLRTLCQELNISFGNDQKANELTHLINEKLLDAHATGRHTIMIIDEAQNLPRQTLEQLRLLTNLETDTQKLLRIIMIGQPELSHMLSEHSMRQVAQRITSRYHLNTLGADETDQYILHRLSVAGCKQRLFSKAATRKIHKLTEGTPRLINLLCDHALIGAYSLGVHEVTPSTIKKAAKEALPYVKVEPVESSSKLLPALVLLLVISVIALIAYRPDLRDRLNQNWQQTLNFVEPVIKKLSFPAVIPDVATVRVAEIKEAELPSSVPVPEPIPEPEHEPEPVLEPISVPIPEPILAPASEPIPEPAPEPRPETPAAAPPGISAEKMEAMKKQAEIDFRLGIPGGNEG